MNQKARAACTHRPHPGVFQLSRSSGISASVSRLRLELHSFWLCVAFMLTRPTPCPYLATGPAPMTDRSGWRVAFLEVRFQSSFGVGVSELRMRVFMPVSPELSAWPGSGGL